LSSVRRCLPLFMTLTRIIDSCGQEAACWRTQENGSWQFASMPLVQALETDCLSVRLAGGGGDGMAC
jgi:hypothetical protein